MKKLTYIIFLLSFCLSTNSVWGQSTQAKVLFASGYIEFKRANGEKWYFVKTGMLLDAANLIRTPPATILRIEWGEERIKIKGCQEDTVSHLIERFRPTSDKPEPPPLVLGDVNDEALAPREKQMKEEKSSSVMKKPSAETLNRIATPDAYMREYVANLIKEKSFPSDEYPYKNLGIARFLFTSSIRWIKEFRWSKSFSRLKH